MYSTEENKLEEILKLAADEPAHRPEFCKVLLNSTVYVITPDNQMGETEDAIISAGSKIEIEFWQKPDGTQIIPFFSSLQLLQNSIEQELSYIKLPAKSLFEITLGTTLFLNPNSDYGKEFVPGEVETLLSVGLSQIPTQRITEENTEVLLGQPSEYPSKMIDSLTQLFVKHKNIKHAFLAIMHDTSIDEKPHLLVGIEADGDLESVLKEAGVVAADTAPNGESVDLCCVTGSDTISKYMINETKPFYERKWGSKIRTSVSGNA
ncbi:MAG: enhanced serine sensitivity protein SseB [Deltaproteobacteria bacterium]|nr:enhanced serine sensitivity protein SseB [Deltaproteobacteria bacterium]